MDRQKLDGFQQSLLASDDSLMRSLIAQHHYQTQKVFDTFMFTNANFPFFHAADGQVPSAILAYLDPTIDYLFIETGKHDKAFYRLKFKQDEHEIIDNNFATIEYYLSSGTVKGITLYQYAIQALQSGGLIFIDGLESHFNLAIVHTFMEYFQIPRSICIMLPSFLARIMRIYSMICLAATKYSLPDGSTVGSRLVVIQKSLIVRISTELRSLCQIILVVLHRIMILI
ncbi:hypothetical protein AAULR_24716 [Lacticaseibacillus rhamnosus MTCC 5462]|nr:hypothetical protein AAULR_24716 [Lacticaseibacillus rhamnosus MTCC 5462]